MACLLDYRPFTTAGFAIRNRWITSHSFRRWIGLRPIGNCWIACYRKSSEIIDGPLECWVRSYLVGPQPVGLAAEVCGRRRGFGYVSVGIPDRAQQYTGPDWTSEMSQTREARRRALAHEQARVGVAWACDNIQPRRNPGLAMEKYRDEASPDRTGRRVDLWAHPKHGMDSVDSVGQSMGWTLRVFPHAPCAI